MAGVAGRSGRKPIRPQMTPALRAILAKMAPDGERTNRRAIAEKLVEIALAGDIQAIKLIYERVDGKVPDAVELTGAEGAPLEIFIRRVTQQADDADAHD